MRYEYNHDPDDNERVVSLSDDDEEVDDTERRHGRGDYDTTMTNIIQTMFEDYNGSIDVILDPKLSRSIRDILDRRDFECCTPSRKGQRQLMDIFQWLQHKWL
jgi:hypothetical protein